LWGLPVSAPTAPAGGPDARGQAARRARSVSATAGELARLVVRSDVALGYAAIVLVVFMHMELIGGARAAAIVAQASTNLQNLRTHPFAALT
jgi:hypothetical protein